MNINKNKIFNPYIYCYTTPTIPEHDGWCKIGYTDSETPEECVRSQGLRVSAPTKLEWAKPARFENSEATPFKDHIFHDFLVTVKHVKRKEDPNYKGNKKPEYFNITPDQARDYLNEFKDLPNTILKENTNTLILNQSYSLREEQEQAVNLTIDIMSKEGRKEVLLNAKPRFGKTLTVYHYCKRENLKNILIVTNRPVIVTSWFNDYMKFLDTNTYKFVTKYKDDLDPEYCLSVKEWNELPNQEDYKLIEFISLQDLKGSKWFSKKGINKLKEESNREWDILIIDESHEGVETFKTEVAFNQIKRQRTIYLSGTPFKQVASDKFEKGSIFNWTYADEQEKKANWDYDIDDVNPYEELPRMNLFTFRLTDMFAKPSDLDSSDVDKYFDLNDFFACNKDGKGSIFVNDSDIDLFLDKLTQDPHYPFANPDFEGQINHSLWLLDRVNSAKALKRKLDNHPFFKGKYKVVLAAGDGKVEDEETVDNPYKEVTQAISTNLKTITLSVGKLTTGVTIPEWSAVFMLCNVKSPSLYIQATFRAQNPGIIKQADGTYTKKQNAYIFDFDPSRTLDIMDQYANDLYQDTAEGKGTKNQRLENIERLIKYFPIYGEDEKGEMVPYNSNDVVTIPSKIKAIEIVKHGFMSNLLFQNIGRLFNDKRALEILSNVKENSQHTLTTKPKYNEDGDVEVDIDAIENEADELLNEVDDNSIEQDQEELQNNTNKQVQDYISTFKSNNNEEVQNRENAFNNYIEERCNYSKKIVTTALDKSPNTIYNRSKIENNAVAGLREKLTESQINYNIECEKRQEAFELALNQANTKEEMKELTAKKAQEDADAELDHLCELKLIEKQFIGSMISDTIKESKETLQEKENKKAENEFAYPKLRAFSRAIPSFLMAYGDSNTTCKTLARVINSEMFKEMTGIDLADYVYFIDKEYFNEAVFNSSIKEFLNLKDKLSNYFEDTDEDIFDYIPPQKTNQIFTPKKVVKEMVDFLEQNDPGCFDDPNHTFIDPYMKSGLYITEIVKKLFNNEKIKEAYPDDQERLKHIFEVQVYGLAPTEILYKITTNFIFGFDKNNTFSRDHFKMLDANKYIGNLEEKLDEVFK